MTKWADYVIIAIRYKKEDSHIEKLRIMKDEGDKLAKEEKTVFRETVVVSIEKGITFVTAYKKGDKWRKGDDVSVVKVNNKK